MSKTELCDYAKRLGEVLRTKDVNKLTEFIRAEMPISMFPSATYQVREITMWKMIANRTDMPQELHKEACDWLLSHGYSTSL